MTKSMYVPIRIVALLVASSGIMGGCAPAGTPDQDGSDGDESPETAIYHATTMIEGQEKVAFGILQSLSAGDVACYVDLVDADGVVHSEMADFDTCDFEAWIGSRVSVEYDMGNVLAASCEGNMDCGLSDRVALISSMRLVDDSVAWPVTTDSSNSSAPLGRSPYVHTVDFQLRGYFSPQTEVMAGGMQLYGIAMPADENDMFDTGEGYVPAFIIDFESGGGFAKVFPDSYLVSAEAVEFIGSDSEIGEVTFKGAFDTDAMRNALDTGLFTAHETLLSGILTINGSQQEVSFSWSE